MMRYVITQENLDEAQKAHACKSRLKVYHVGDNLFDKLTYEDAVWIEDELPEIAETIMDDCGIPLYAMAYSSSVCGSDNGYDDGYGCGYGQGYSYGDGCGYNNSYGFSYAAVSVTVPATAMATATARGTVTDTFNVDFVVNAMMGWV